MLFLVNTILTDSLTHVMTLLFLAMAHRAHQDYKIVDDVRLMFNLQKDFKQVILPFPEIRPLESQPVK